MLSSKELAYILRHAPEKYNLKLDKEGWCNVDKLLKETKTTFTHLKKLVDNNTRFIFNSNNTMIKAAHGHSIDVEYAKNREATPPTILFHGTSDKAVNKILKEGLSKMNRAKVHLSENYEDAKRIGSRHGEPRVLFIYTRNLISRGWKFYKSEDGVWLTDDIPFNYLNIINKTTEQYFIKK